MTGALEVAQRAQSNWVKNHGDESLYGQCQRFDGWYWQNAYQGNENITTYPSAEAAANASTFFATGDVNDSRIGPGDLLYFWYEDNGHVVTALGRDGSRLIVTNTANTGDDLGQLGSHVKISHADTIGLDFRGASHTNGKNAVRSGLTAYNIGGGGTPATGKTLDLAGSSWYWYNSASEADQLRNPHGGKYTGEPMLKGTYPVSKIDPNGSIQVKANDGTYPWVNEAASKYLR